MGREKKTPLEKRKPFPRVSLRGGLGFLSVFILTLCLVGPPVVGLRHWVEGQVAPGTVYAPFSFTIKEQEKETLIQQGERVVSRGDRLTASHIACLKAIHLSNGQAKGKIRWAGAFLLALLFTALGSIYLRRYEKAVWKRPSRMFLILACMSAILGCARLLFHAPLDAPGWIPIASVAMLLGMLLSPRIGIVFGVITSILVSTMFQLDLAVLSGFVTGCFAGAYAVKGIRRRIDFFRAGVVAGTAQGLAILGSFLFLQIPSQELLTPVLGGIAGGVLSATITFCLLPLCESLFGLVTDVTLLEMSDLNQPLLRDLSVKAPGTYHHSLIVANLAEAACETIGANPLLARVGCYFHDIGKMLHPEYFVENQPPPASRHDRLTPSLSSLVILNHVKDGMDLARKARLNQAIIDFIPGHHGTGLIYYFYRRALEEVEDEALLKEERFRYPGPKPQTRETAVALLSDSVEAATRALKEKTPARIQDVVRRIINNKFIDGQLEECDLTLKDLHRISEAFLRVLAGMYHQRVEYPAAPGEESQPAPERKAAG